MHGAKLFMHPFSLYTTYDWLIKDTYSRKSLLCKTRTIHVREKSMLNSKSAPSAFILQQQERNPLLAQLLLPLLFQCSPRFPYRNTPNLNNKRSIPCNTKEIGSILFQLFSEPYSFLLDILIKSFKYDQVIYNTTSGFPAAGGEPSAYKCICLIIWIICNYIYFTVNFINELILMSVPCRYTKSSF